jgi:ubiquinone/menaquinone biosynthesis C-methylase UbiE
MQPVNYDEISRVYDDVREGDVILINRFLQEIQPTGTFNALDIGCGTGNYTNLLQQRTQAKVYGIDPSEGMLSKARQKNGRIVFLQGTAEDIPFEDDLFDFAFMTDVIHHVGDIDKMFAEIHRVLGSRGKVCIVTQSHKQIEARPIARYFPGTARVDKIRYPDIDEIIAAAKDRGLRGLKQEILFENNVIELGPDYLALVRKKGYSMLHLISEHQYRVGLKALESALKKGPVKTRLAGETLVWFAKA